MKLARIVGTVVATEKHPALTGVRLLIAQPHDHHGQPDGAPIVVADALQAGEGQQVKIVFGREASLALPTAFTPVDAAVVALVDGVDNEAACPRRGGER